jgi:hypothetical protein
MGIKILLGGVGKTTTQEGETACHYTPSAQPQDRENLLIVSLMAY